MELRFADLVSGWEVCEWNRKPKERGLLTHSVIRACRSSTIKCTVSCKAGVKVLIAVVASRDSNGKLGHFLSDRTGCGFLLLHRTNHSRKPAHTEFPRFSHRFMPRADVPTEVFKTILIVIMRVLQTLVVATRKLERGRMLSQKHKTQSNAFIPTSHSIFRYQTSSS